MVPAESGRVRNYLDCQKKKSKAIVFYLLHKLPSSSQSIFSHSWPPIPETSWSVTFSLCTCRKCKLFFNLDSQWTGSQLSFWVKEKKAVGATCSQEQSGEEKKMASCSSHFAHLTIRWADEQASRWAWKQLLFSCLSARFTRQFFFRPHWESVHRLQSRKSC